MVTSLHCFSCDIASLNTSESHTTLLMTPCLSSIQNNMGTPACLIHLATFIFTIANIVLGWILVCQHPEGSIIGAAVINTLSIIVGPLAGLCVFKCVNNCDGHSSLAVKLFVAGAFQSVGHIVFLIAGCLLLRGDAFGLRLAAGITGGIAAACSFISTCCCCSNKKKCDF